MAVKDMTGLVIGRLTVIKDSGKRNKSGIVYWTCVCECGNLKDIQGRSLRKKNPTQSCGCLQKESAINQAHDLTGQKFNRLTVLEKLIGYRNDKKTYYNCLCECGKETVQRSDSLKSGHSKSCGCYDIENLKSQRGKNSPSYNPDISDEEREYKRTLNATELKEWRQAVFERDNYTCQCCFERGVHLHAHHLNSYNWAKDERYDIENGCTTCKECHKDFHKKFGYGDNTKEQFYEYQSSLKGGVFTR